MIIPFLVRRLYEENFETCFKFFILVCDRIFAPDHWCELVRLNRLKFNFFM